jgi:hypothetical protein
MEGIFIAFRDFQLYFLVSLISESTYFHILKIILISVLPHSIYLVSFTLIIFIHSIKISYPLLLSPLPFHISLLFLFLSFFSRFHMRQTFLFMRLTYFS